MLGPGAVRGWAAGQLLTLPAENSRQMEATSGGILTSAANIYPEMGWGGDSCKVSFPAFTMGSQGRSQPFENTKFKVVKTDSNQEHRMGVCVCVSIISKYIWLQVLLS